MAGCEGGVVLMRRHPSCRYRGCEAPALGHLCFRAPPPSHPARSAAGIRSTDVGNARAAEPYAASFTFLSVIGVWEASSNSAPASTPSRAMSSTGASSSYAAYIAPSA